MPLHEILIDTELPMMIVTAARQTFIYLILRDKILMQHLHAVLYRVFRFLCA